MSNTPKLDRPQLGIALIIFAMLVFALQDGITKHLATTYSAPQILWIRFSFFVVFALVYSMRTKPLRSCLTSNVPVLQIIRSLLIVAEIGFFILAVRHLPLAETHALFATFPLMATAIAALFLKEPVGIRRWSAIIVGLMGVIIILRPGAAVIAPAALIALLCAFMFAGYQVITRLVSKFDDSETSVTYMAVVGLIAMTALGPFFWKPPDAEGWKWLLLLALTAALGHFLLIKALEFAPASLLQPFNFTLLVFASTVGYFAFGDVPDMWTVLGAIVIVGSGIYTVHRERMRGIKPPNQPVA
jgi:drug/metabolite transporter (DMT)-like permease